MPPCLIRRDQEPPCSSLLTASRFCKRTLTISPTSPPRMAGRRTACCWPTRSMAFPIGEARPRRCSNAAAWRVVRHHQLAPPATRGDKGAGRATRAGNRHADDTGGNRCRDRPGGFYAGAAGRPAALALCLRGNGRPATAARRPHLGLITPYSRIDSFIYSRVVFPTEKETTHEIR